MTLVKPLVALAPACILLSGSIALFVRGKTLASWLQLLGAGCLMVVVAAHICEALDLFPGLRWGAPDSIGHYVDLYSAALGLTLFPIGYLLHALAKRNA